MIALLLPLLAHAAVDLTKIPSEFCEPAEDLIGDARACEDNQALSQGAQRCYEKLENLERKLGEDAMAIAQAGPKNQRGEMSTGAAEYSFSDRAMVHLIRIARLAQAELEPFPSYLMAPARYYDPSLEDPEAYAENLDCHGGVERRLAEVQKRLAAKVERFEARRREARANQSALRARMGGIDSLSGAGAKGRAGPERMPAPTGASPKSASTITGAAPKKAGK